MATKTKVNTERRILKNKKKTGSARKKFSGKDQKPKRYRGQGRR
jgi:hypothetical protein